MVIYMLGNQEISVKTEAIVAILPALWPDFVDLLLLGGHKLKGLIPKEKWVRLEVEKLVNTSKWGDISSNKAVHCSGAALEGSSRSDICGSTWTLLHNGKSTTLRLSARATIHDAILHAEANMAKLIISPELDEGLQDEE
jgi:hypothetical protein